MLDLAGERVSLCPWVVVSLFPDLTSPYNTAKQPPIGITNWLFAIPAVYTIDTFGRRNLLLTTFPWMAIFLFWSGFSFYIEDQQTRTAMVATGIYLYMIVYSPGEGPVPFTYSAEAFVSLPSFTLPNPP